jgi:putative membrane protein
MAEPGIELRQAAQRTRMASERTQLAWWRTGLTALAVALAVGRVIPELEGSDNQVGYSLIGVGFAIYGVVMIVYGTQRGHAMEEAIEKGSGDSPRDWVLTGLTVGGVVLGLCVAVLVVV